MCILEARQLHITTGENLRPEGAKYNASSLRSPGKWALGPEAAHAQVKEGEVGGLGRRLQARGAWKERALGPKAAHAQVKEGEVGG